jgi:hypothetical protein
MPGDQYEAPNRLKFHFNREISLGHVLQAAVILGMVFVFATKLENRITVLEVTQDFTGKGIAEIKQMVADINRKLDR